MGNISFSKVGKAILANNALANHLSLRMSNLTEEEIRLGSFNVEFVDGTILNFKFGSGGSVENQNKTETSRKTPQPA